MLDNKMKKKKTAKKTVHKLDKSALSDKTTSPPPTQQLPTTEEEVKELQKDLLYLRAEFENYKKQAIKERSELIRYGGQNLAMALLDILDNFDRALDIEINAETIKSFREGIQLTASGLNSVLNQFGIKEVDCINQPFDPTLHEAMGSEESSQVPPGHITQVFKKPYLFHQKVLRPGQVIIAKEKESEKAK